MIFNFLKKMVLATIILTGGVSSLSAQTQILCKHFFGETVVPVQPKRVAVLDIGVLEQLDFLGVDVVAVPDEVPDHLAKYRDAKYVKLGGVWAPHPQAVREANPDLIFFGAWDEAMYQELSKIAPTVGYAENINDVLGSYVPYFKFVGQIFGKEQEVEDYLIARYAEINRIRAFTKEQNKTALILLATQGRLHAFGAGSRFGLIHDELGFKPACDTLSTDIKGTIVDDAFLSRINPDMIFMIDRDLALKGVSPGADGILTDGIKQSNAFKNGRVFWLQPATWYLSGQGTKILKDKIQDITDAVEVMQSQQ